MWQQNSCGNCETALTALAAAVKRQRSFGQFLKTLSQLKFEKARERLKRDGVLRLLLL